uniref:ArfGAP with RhoGAP domain, ankyrin repeat and PH domain 1 n=1 Tax=Eptatretus burgeri TaxID=7764 RepID=A0A8C4NC54_EPTBU
MLQDCEKDVRLSSCSLISEDDDIDNDGRLFQESASYEVTTTTEDLMRRKPNVYEMVDEHKQNWTIEDEEIYTECASPEDTYAVCNDDVGDNLEKTGWLEKQAPQGKAGLFQKRFVKLDKEHLQYFNSEQEIFAKGVIPLSAIKQVMVGTGDSKFHVVTTVRTFTFRASSVAERDDWGYMLQRLMRMNRTSSLAALSMASGSGTTRSGSLELRGYRHRLHVSLSNGRLWLYKSAQDMKGCIGISFINMNVTSSKAVDKRGFDINTPWKTFSFVAESEAERDEWLTALSEATSEALSSMEVAEQVWANKSNGFCADCGAPFPDWASINMLVVICKQCAGEHRFLGASISKVRSLKMDKDIWTREVIKLFQTVGNQRSNSFWAANVPPSEALSIHDGTEKRRAFILAKYMERKYRKVHPLFGQQEQLNEALCAAVMGTDLLETMALIFCGADVAHAMEVTSNFAEPTRTEQFLQKELIFQNRLNVINMTGPPEQTARLKTTKIIRCGYLWKTASLSKLPTERRAKEDFNQRWCVLEYGAFSYFENEKSITPNGRIYLQDILSLAMNGPNTGVEYGFPFTLELSCKNERIYLFGSDDAEAVRDWSQSLAKAFTSVDPAVPNLEGFWRMGRLWYWDGQRQRARQHGLFALRSSFLNFCFPSSDIDCGNGKDADSSWNDSLNLRKLQEISDQIIEGHQTIVLVEKRRTIYMQSDSRLDFASWRHAMETASLSSSLSLSHQQLTELDVPVTVHRCVEYITQHGITSEGIYRKCGRNSHVHVLLEAMRSDARAVWLREGEHPVDDVANVLKRFLRELSEGLFKSNHLAWIRIAGIEDVEEKLAQYKVLIKELPTVNRATVTCLMDHLYCVQYCSHINQMTTRNLSIVFGPTLFQTEGRQSQETNVVEDLITNYRVLFKIKMAAGDLIIEVYVEAKKPENCVSLKVSAQTSADELKREVLYLKHTSTDIQDSWAVFEVIAQGELERPLHYKEKVLDLLLLWGTVQEHKDNFLLMKKNVSMGQMKKFLADKVVGTFKNRVKYREDNSRFLSHRFQDKVILLNFQTLFLFKDEKSLKPEKEWSVLALKFYIGIRKKLKPPSCWGLTFVQEKQQWLLSFNRQAELRDFFACLLHFKYDGDVWPVGSTELTRPVQDHRSSNRSLIPLRGSEAERTNLRDSIIVVDPVHLPWMNEAQELTEGTALPSCATQKNSGKPISVPEKRKDVKQRIVLAAPSEDSMYESIEDSSLNIWSPSWKSTSMVTPPGRPPLLDQSGLSPTVCQNRSCFGTSSPSLNVGISTSSNDEQLAKDDNNLQHLLMKELSTLLKQNSLSNSQT